MRINYTSLVIALPNTTGWLGYVRSVGQIPPVGARADLERIVGVWRDAAAGNKTFLNTENMVNANR